MDDFLEYLVKKKNMGTDIATKTGIVLLALFVMMIVFFIFMSIQFLRSFAFFGMLVVGYGAYLWLKRLTIEYEYIFTNGDLDIDIIRGRQFRKRLVAIKCKDITIMKSVEPDEVKNIKDSANRVKNICAVYNWQGGGIYKIETAISGGGWAHIVFQPPEKLVNVMKKYNPRNIINA